MVGPWGWWWTVQCLVGGWKTVIFSMEGGPYWVESCLTSSLIIFMIGCDILSVSLLMTQSWEEWLTDGMVAIQRDLTGWRSGLTGTSASTAKSCNWWGRPTHQCIQGAMQTERRLVEMDLEVLTDPKLNRNQRGVLAVWNVTGVSAASEILPSKQGVPSPLLSTGEVSSDILHSARLPRRRLINYWRESRKGP